ncbi:uncharacterized protein G2W53_039911 [Senna tora]|uniref:Uncharacterized protein n=1 Tax=Senna tora TaxID=362788 RepID=A0A834SRV1_9FABA|nr:uncharacterized protein G2W53_039911 [Senna tora]
MVRDKVVDYGGRFSIHTRSVLFSHTFIVLRNRDPDTTTPGKSQTQSSLAHKSPVSCNGMVAVAESKMSLSIASVSKTRAFNGARADIMLRKCELVMNVSMPFGEGTFFISRP